MATAPDRPVQPGSPLSEDQLQDAAATFGILAATARLQIVWLLAGGERDVSSLAREVGQTVAAVSQHLAKLKLAGLVRLRRCGRHSYYLLDDRRLVDLVVLAVDPHDRPAPHTRSRGA